MRQCSSATIFAPALTDPIMFDLVRIRARLIGFVLPLLLAPAMARAQAVDIGVHARTAARTYRQHNEAAIVDEFTTLLAVPNLASDSANIRRNADLLLQMLGRRGFHNARLLTVPNAPPAVYGELMTPGASRTLVLYAHYDGQPLDPRQWATPPWEPVLRDRALEQGGTAITVSSDKPLDPESRIYARSAGDDKASIMAILAAIDAMHEQHVEQSVNLKVFFEAEEEAGSGHLKQILETYAPTLTADAWLFCDGPVHPSGREEVVFGMRGVTGFELTV